MTYSRHLKQRVVFFPTPITTLISNVISNPMAHCISAGQIGCGKTYTIMLNTMLNKKIIAEIIKLTKE